MLRSLHATYLPAAHHNTAVPCRMAAAYNNSGVASLNAANLSLDAHRQTFEAFIHSFTTYRCSPHSVATQGCWGGQWWLRRSQEGCCPVDRLLTSAAGHQECMQPVSVVESVQTAASQSDDCCLEDQDVALCMALKRALAGFVAVSRCRSSSELIHIYRCCTPARSALCVALRDKLLLMSCMLLLPISRPLTSVCTAARSFMMGQCHAAGRFLCT